MFLEKELHALYGYIPEIRTINPPVSQVSVGWHLDHSLIVIIAIIQVLQQSQPSSYRWRPNLGRWYIFSRGSIPRGRGKSPKSVLPGEISESNLKLKLQTTKEHIALLDKLHRRCHFTSIDAAQLLELALK